jgi:hypothetical protein
VPKRLLFESGLASNPARLFVHPRVTEAGLRPVTRRTSEIGIRMALGADCGKVLGLVFHGAMLQIALGLTVGIPATLAGSRLLESQLYGVKGYDPVTLGLAAVVLAACASPAGFYSCQGAAAGSRHAHVGDGGDGARRSDLPR